MRPKPNSGAEVEIGAAAELELERLVAEEVAALAPPAEEPVEALIDRLAARLRGHPEASRLVDRLSAAVLGPPATPVEGPADAD